MTGLRKGGTMMIFDRDRNEVEVKFPHLPESVTTPEQAREVLNARLAKAWAAAVRYENLTARYSLLRADAENEVQRLEAALEFVAPGVTEVRS